VQGTGLLVSIDVSPDHFAIVGKGQLEEHLRRNGIGVIHGGVNSLRFTPHFSINEAEADLLVDHVRKALKNGPRQQAGKQPATVDVATEAA
jgi:acetylornithine/succinyldiaminopimelate/putrescine aminotransferase